MLIYKYKLEGELIMAMNHNEIELMALIRESNDLEREVMQHGHSEGVDRLIKQNIEKRQLLMKTFKENRDYGNRI